MHRLLFAALCCSAAHAAVIRGVVLDRSTGRPLARSLVPLRPVEGVGGKPQSVRADRTGQFAFSVSAGMYLLRASRDGFAPFQYGQKEWKSAGKPMSVEQDGSLYLDIRLRRYAAISGTVLDENEIGIPDQKAIARTACPASSMWSASSGLLPRSNPRRARGCWRGVFPKSANSAACRSASTSRRRPPVSPSNACYAAWRGGRISRSDDRPDGSTAASTVCSWPACTSWMPAATTCAGCGAASFNTSPPSARWCHSAVTMPGPDFATPRKLRASTMYEAFPRRITAR